MLGAREIRCRRDGRVPFYKVRLREVPSFGKPCDRNGHIRTHTSFCHIEVTDIVSTCIMCSHSPLMRISHLVLLDCMERGTVGGAFDVQ